MTRLLLARKTMLGLPVKLTIAGAIAAYMGAPLFGQNLSTEAPATASHPALVFDVASVKPSGPDSRVHIRTLPNGYEATDLPLKAIISNAYNIRQDLISGAPGWTESTSYDIAGKWSSSVSAALQVLSSEQRAAQVQLMLQALLADRFHLVVRHVPKVMPIYQLVVARNGPKLKESDPNNTYSGGIKSSDGTTHGVMRSGPGQVIAQSVPMSRLATNLSYQVGRTVEDKTGLAGNYDFILKWSPDETTNTTQDSASDPALPSFFTAIEEQLGLKLEPTRGPVDSLVIDHIEKPSPN